MNPRLLLPSSGIGLLHAAALALAAVATAAPAQPANPHATSAGWQACATLTGDTEARLACFDRWAAQPRAPEPGAPSVAPPALATRQPTADGKQPAEPALTSAAPPAAPVPGCRDTRYSELSRSWELERDTSCGTFRIRGYRPISLSVIGSNGVAKQPTSPNPLNDASTEQPYRRTETRLQLSVRTKLATGLLTRHNDPASDSLWFGYTQQSYWQLFTPSLSRPFRNTDHEPELIYVYPTDAPLPGGWRLRYSGLGVVHQSNGQSLPLSRSWNRIYLMSGMEHGRDFRVTARVWKRISENASNDDNPDISRYVGRAEVAGFWMPSATDTLGVTLRHALSRPAHGSARLEWLRTLGEAGSDLRFHTQLFTGYGDSLVDYNRRRTVLSVGLSLVDF